MEGRKQYKIEHILMPAYYKTFQCIGGACRDSCCKEWRIEFGKKDYLRIKQAPASPELREKLDRGVRRNRGPRVGEEHTYARFDLDGNQGACPLLREDCLCDLQMECGHQCLPEVCKTFPRSKFQNIEAYEYSLSPACEAVLGLLWELPEGVDFLVEDLPERERKLATVGEGAPLLPLSPYATSVSIDFLQDRRYSMAERMILLGMALRDLASRSESGVPDGAAWAADCAAIRNDSGAKAALEQLSGNREVYVLNNIKLLFKIQGANPTVNKLIQEMMEDLHIELEMTFQEKVEMAVKRTDYGVRYAECLDRFHQELGDLEYFFENLMVAVLFNLHYPQMTGGEDVWKSYVNLCNLYGFYRFAAVAACAREASRERLFHAMTQVSRAMLHNQTRQVALRDEFFENDSATLAHMAILVLG